MGFVIMLQGLLRNKLVMDAFANSFLDGDEEFKAAYLSQDDWNAISEFEGVLSHLQSCSMSLQSDEPSSSCACLIEIYLSKHCIDLRRPNAT